MRSLLALLVLCAPISAATITVPAGGDLQAAYNAASCGDLILLQAGATWDTPSVNTAFNFNKSCTASAPLTIKSAGTLPSRRIGPADSGVLARIRAKGGEGAVNFNPSGAYQILDGLEITNVGTDTSAEIVGNLIIATMPAVNNITIQRSWLHPKETGTDYTRSVLEAIYFNGTGLLFKWNYANGFFGRMAAGDTGVNTNRIILCVTCNNLTVEDSFLEAWYAAIFTGGGQEDPQYTATLSNATDTQATFSNTTGLSPGRYVRFELQGSGTVSGTSFTRTSGAVLTAADTEHAMWMTNTTGQVYRVRIKAVTGDQWTTEVYGPGQAPNGDYKFSVFEVAEVKTINGSVVTYSGVGINRLTQAPTTPGQAAWRVDQVVHDIKILRNTFNIDYGSALAEHNLTGNSPKGWAEHKSGDRILWDGNTFTGWVSTIGPGQYSNEGTTPWTKVQNFTVRNSFVNPIPSIPGSAEYQAARAFITGHLVDPYNTAEPGCCLTAENNLVLNEATLFLGRGFTTARFVHNTIMNNQNPRSSWDTYPSLAIGLDPQTGWEFSNNIAFQNDGGFNYQGSGGMTAGWPGLVKANNVIVDNTGWNNLPTIYGSGILSPVVKTIGEIGFVNAAANDYTLSASSPFKGKASDGKDPGVDMVQLLAALSGSPQPTPSPTPLPTATPTPTPVPTPSPTPVPTATPTPLPSPTPVPSPSPSPSPTPTPTGSCTISVPSSISVPSWDIKVLAVTLSNLTGTTQVTAIASSGQVSVYPGLKTVTGTSAIISFQVGIKRKSGSITFNSPCGQKVSQILME